MYDAFLIVAFAIVTCVVVLLNRDETLIYFMGIIGSMVVVYYGLTLISARFIILTGFLFGLFLARIAHDELSIGRQWISLVLGISILGLIVSMIFSNEVYEVSFSFIITTCIPSLWKHVKKSKI